MLKNFLITTFSLLALYHVVWAVKGPNPDSPTIPRENGQPVFVPSRMAALLVAFAFLFGIGLINANIHWAMLGMSLVFGLRAIGEFKYVGFFKKVKGSPFARLDTIYYSPLCLVIAACLLSIGLKGVHFGTR